MCCITSSIPLARMQEFAPRAADRRAADFLRAGDHAAQRAVLPALSRGAGRYVRRPAGGRRHYGGNDPWISNQAFPTLLTGRIATAANLLSRPHLAASSDFHSWAIRSPAASRNGRCCRQASRLAFARRMVGSKAVWTSGRISSIGGLRERTPDATGHAERQNHAAIALDRAVRDRAAVRLPGADAAFRRQFP